MKKIYTLLAVAALGALLWSCTKDKNNDPTPPPPPPVETGLLLNETFGTSATGNPSVDSYTGYSKTGHGAAKVAYLSSGGTTSVRTTKASSGYTGASGSCNAMMASGGASLIVKNIASCGATNITLSFGSNHVSDTITLAYSADNGTTWTPLSYTKTTADWGLVSGIAITLPNGTSCFALKFTAAKTGFGARIDDITVKTTDATGAPSDCSDPVPSGDEVLNETLTTQGSFDKFTAQNVTGAQVWTFSTSQYGALMTGFADGATSENEDWFISPAMNLAGATSATLTFDHARGPAASMAVSTSNYTLWISTDYTSGAPSTATWTQLTIPTHGTAAWGYVSSGQIALTQLAANTRFAFKYVCDNAESATWEIKNVVVRAEGVAPVPMLSFTSAAAASGRVGNAFSHTFTVKETNVTGTTSYAVTTGTLPAGLTLSGATISGTPTTAATTPLTITATNGTATATQAFTITIGADIPGSLVLGENFNGFSAGATGAGASSTDISGSLDSKTQQPGWSGSKVYEAGGTAKMSTSSVAGWLQTPAIDLSANGGQFTVNVKSMAWSGDATSIKIYVNGTEVSPSPIQDLNNNTSYALKEYTFNLTGGTAATTIKFEAAAAAKGRFFLEDLGIYQ